MANVTIQKNAFAFCRYTLTALVWLSLVSVVMGWTAVALWCLGVVFAVMALSAILTVRRAPLVWLWTNTIGRVVESEDVTLDVGGMRFSHTLATVFAAASIALAWQGSPWAPWVVGAFALLKTINAVYACPAYQLYGCVVRGGG